MGGTPTYCPSRIEAMTAPSRGEQIVSSAHLVSEASPELSEFEFGLIIAGHAFNRWIVRCMAATGLKDLGALDVLVLHWVNHRDREKKLADICLALNVEDSHLVTYALKKLAKLGLIERRRRGKEIFFSTNEAGQAACARYREIREACLIAALDPFTGDRVEALNPEIGRAAELLRALSGLYDQAARAATSL